MRAVRRKGATPAGGESGGRQTVQLRGGRAGPVRGKAYVYPGQVTNRSRHADNGNVPSAISSLAVSSSAEAGRRPAAAFFDRSEERRVGKEGRSYLIDRKSVV